MKSKTTLLVAAIAAGFALTATAEARGFGENHGRMGPGAQLPGFEELDLNGDGSLTQEEMQEAMQARAQARFDEADSNGDGALSAEELAAMMQAMQAEMLQQRAEQMLSRMDANEDGMLQADELPGAGAAPGNGRGDGRFFSRLDANDDGALSAEEFAALEDWAAERRDGDRRGPRGGFGRDH